MEQQTYTHAFRVILCGLRLFFRCWWATLRRLGNDLLHGIFQHWFFTLTLVVIYIAMFVIMGRARAERDRGEIINYELTQKVDSLTMKVR